LVQLNESAIPNEEDPTEEIEQTTESTLDETPPSDPPSSQTTSDEPDAAYKGLQRVLAKEQARARELEARIQQIESQPADNQSNQIIAGMIAEVEKYDPERAGALRQSFEVYKVNSENVRLRNQQMEDAQARVLREAEERNTQELRAIVADLGADPDSPAIDYGDSNEWFAERITKARASAKEAVKKVKAVTPPARTTSDGTAHNTQPGTPPQAPPRSNSKAEVTEDQLKAAQEKYTRAYLSGKDRAEAKAELDDLNSRFAAQLFG
jgi:hypothetical protein